MPRIILDLGFLQVVMSHITRKPSGLWLYQRRYPQDLKRHFDNKTLKKVNLKTHNEQEAIKAAARLAADDDKLWASMRTNAAQDLGLTTSENRDAAMALVKEWGLSAGDGYRTGRDATARVSEVVDILDAYFIRRYDDYEQSRGDTWYAANIKAPDEHYTPVEAEAVRLVMGDPAQKRVLLSDALSSYLSQKKRDHKFEQSSRRYVSFMTDAFGDLPIESYTKQNVNTIRDKLLAGGAKTATVKRYFKALSLIFSHGIDEFDLKGVTNPFSRFKIPKDGEDAEKRDPFTIDELKMIARSCKEWDDEVRHMIAIQLDTGARIGEIVGLRIEDIVLTLGVSHVRIRRDDSLGRSLKTKSSARNIPLVGNSLWGAQRALECRGGAKKGWLFPQYAAGTVIKAGHATNTVNDWIQDTLKIPKSSHSFRHSIADRLRAVEAPQGIIDAIGGWSSQTSMSRNYGAGHMLEQLKGWLDRVVF